MRSERWAQIEDLFHRAAECEPDERFLLLEEVGAKDQELRREVELLLSSYEGAGAHLRAVVGGNAQSIQESRDAVAATLAMNAAGANTETVIGPYHLLQPIGEGGMGEVWLAEQREPVRRRVALKLLKSGMNTREVIARFESERQALALMDHPAIAKVFDAGATSQGAPYFVMEYVAGVPITAYCDRHTLSTRERLELFIHVCGGVQHAHQKAIIHRDLKPSNILVTEVDGQAAPKIIDFGVAKALGQKLTADTLFTLVGALVGTPEYMSPEQALSSGEDIDTRTDVYSLGTVLYELLAGSPPLDLRKIALDEFLRKLREEEPPKPSTKIRTQDAVTSLDVARKRQTEALSLAKQMRGDLDAIALKALEKDRSRRYGSPADLAADIGRYLKNEAVLAVPPSAAYRVRKFARRYRTEVSVGAVALVALFGATVSVAWEARIARQERDLAQRRFNDVRGLARQVIFDLQSQLAALSGTTQLRKDLVAVGINYLDTLAKDGSADQGLQSELATAYLSIGNIQGGSGTQNLGDLPGALESYAKAERLARMLAAREPAGPAKRLLGDVLTAEAYAASNANQPAKSAAKAKEALQVARERTRSDPTSEDAQIQLGAALQCAASFGGAKDGLPYLVEEASVFEGMLAHHPENLIWLRNAALAHKYIASRLLDSEDRDGAFAHLERAEQLDEACVRAAPNNPTHKMDLAIDMGQWGAYYAGKKDIAKGIQYTQESLAIRRELAAADPKDAWAQDRLAYSLTRLGDMQLNVSALEALASYREARSIAERLQMESMRKRGLGSSIFGMGRAYQELGDVRRSCAAYAEATKVYRGVSKPLPGDAIRAEDAEKAYSHCLGANR